MLLMIDFSCALGAGVVYACLFDFMQEIIGLPKPLVYVHILMNTVYGLFGVWIFLSGRMKVFKVLAWMNVAYVLPCFVVAGILGWVGNLLGAGIFLVEGIVVGKLGQIEINTLKRSSQ